MPFCWFCHDAAHIWSLLLHENTGRCTKTRHLWKKWTVNLYCLWLKTRGNGTFTVCVFWKRHFQGKYQRHVFTFATLHASDADVTYDGPGMHTITCKAAKQVYNSTWIALLKHGFVLVKTWLLIACGTGFYAIISLNIFKPDVFVRMNLPGLKGKSYTY